MSNDESVTTSDNARGYTDADVLNAWTALRQGSSATTTQAIHAILDAVAPAIVARAKAEVLREAADAIRVSRLPTCSGSCHESDSIVLDIRAAKFARGQS